MAQEPQDPMLDAALQAALRLLGWNGDGELAIGGVAVRDLAAAHGTPFYAFDGGLLAARAMAVQAAFGPEVGVLYSLKANPNVAVTALLRRQGLGAEVASLGELEVALAAGHDAAQLRFAGPGKTDAEIAVAVRRGLGCFHVEAPSELEAVAAAARAAGRKVRVALRVNPQKEQAGSRLRMAGSGARFGIDAAAVPALLQRIAGDPALTIAGLHVYAGTQSFDADAFVGSAAALCAQRDEWERDVGVRLDELDFGGGFGSATYLGDPQFDLERAGRGLRALVAAGQRPGRRWWIELGRYLTAPAGIYVARVARRKQNGGRTHLALDGGLHHCAIATGIGSVLRRPPLLVAPLALADPRREVVAVGGPLCTPQDQFADALALPPLVEGDLVAVLGVGAYGATFSPTGFLGHAAPCELLVTDGKARTVRRRGEPQDALRDQVP